MIKTRSRKNKPDKESFYAVCRDCGSIKDESFDHRRCECGGVFHVDSARCIRCGSRHPFSRVGEKCSCDGEGEIVAKMVTCPVCKQNATISHLGEYCPECNVQLKMEG